MLAQTTSGGVCIKDVGLHYLSPFLFFGGANSSGIGRTRSFYGSGDFCNDKAVLRSVLRAPPARLVGRRGGGVLGGPASRRSPGASDRARDPVDLYGRRA